MAKYTIKHTCGHESTANIIGHYTHREATINRLESRICDACYKAQQDEKCKAEFEQAQIVAETMGLPALTGTPKQIQWAETLRTDMLERAQIAVNRAGSDKREMMEYAYARMRRETEASTWIGWRQTGVETLMIDLYFGGRKNG